MIHELAYVHPGAKIGRDVYIGPFTTIYDDVEVGDGTHISPNVTIFSGSRIGKNCKIFPGAVIAAIPQDLKFSGEYTTVEIGDNTTIRECVTINRGTTDKLKTTVGNNCLLMAYSHIAHDAAVGNNCILANNATVAGHVVIEDFVVIEGVVAIQQFVRIGQHAFIAGGSLVRKNVPPFVKAAREPLSFAGINAVGMRRRGIAENVVKQVEDLYRIIYVLNKNTSKALEIVEAEIPASAEKTSIIDFIKSSEKGIMRG